jgi:hypothetical protein
VSAGRLTDAEADHHADGGESGAARTSVTRTTASASYYRRSEGHTWATTLAWGANQEGDVRSHAALVETSLTIAARHTVFGRAELTGKPAHDLDIPGIDDVVTLSKLQVGYTRHLRTWRGLEAGLGAGASAAIVPARLASTYGGRVSPGLAVFLHLRPAAH